MLRSSGSLQQYDVSDNIQSLIMHVLYVVDACIGLLGTWSNASHLMGTRWKWNYWFMW